ncbi:MAG: polyprenyl synthetase family protein [Paludibacter sp.]
MNFIEKIRNTILLEMELFAETFVEALNTDNQLLLSVNEYMLKKSGKQLRPIITILTAKMCGEVNEKTIYGAHSLELLHTASLIHDDVVDDTLERRGKPSINAIWTNKIAIYSGDYMFSKSLSYAIKTNNLLILKSVSDIGNQLTDGELLQLVNTDISKTSEENYFNIIKKKTAQLFSSCAEVGGLSVDANHSTIEHLRKYGEYLGICFQIKDDIFDYFDDIQIGKPTGNDIRDGKITLPLIYALQNSSEEEKKRIVAWIDNKDFSAENIKSITNFAHENGGVNYSIMRMEEFKNKAIEELKSFDDSDEKMSLVLCAEYAASREF